ncbi:MAG: LysM domain-containing protein [Aromatoleum sp.]|jgi:hypothetical protein|uniref:LysM peptidoglycan-binding domain-containing protein n=1 Tax=Aromatoleum sp. TaxID=2307007 RepID=UPI00289400D7|nr:LysM domain-containing protein [Aromatoleum sp.]MDT3671576.1 LysM domain-containing protein [Aromatoleum sp.]
MIRIIFPLLFTIAALLAGPAGAAPAALAEDAPDSYTVVRGDTLWDISGRFLKEPWRWPEVWRLNRDEIRNPHLIYPGQVILLDRSGPYLSIGRRVGAPLYEKRFPQAYSEPIDGALPSIPMQAIEPFLSRSLVVDEGDLKQAGTVIATDASRVFTGAGDTIFAKDVQGRNEVWEVFRPAKPLVDPLSGEVLGYEAAFLGQARMTEPGRPATLKLLSAVEEIGVGDRLIASERPEIFSFVPHAPEGPIAGRLIGIHQGLSETGRLNVVTLNVGSNAGIERGHVLALHRNRGNVVYKDEAGGKETFELPQQRYGVAFVFRVFDRVAYALVMESDGPVTVGDTVRQP